MNRTAKTCALRGRPAIVVAPGGPGPLSVAVTERDPSVPPGFPPQGRRFGVAPGGKARLILWVVRPCDHERGSGARQHLRAYLLNGDAQASFTILSCRGIGAELSVGVFQPVGR